jgi:hypothetical protein
VRDPSTEFLADLCRELDRRELDVRRRRPRRPRIANPQQAASIAGLVAD